MKQLLKKLQLKKQIFSQLEEIAKPGSILATNTSGLDINEIASMTNRTGDVIGLHFFSPANVMKLLEIVQGKHTKANVIKSCIDIAQMINKVPCSCRSL